MKNNQKDWINCLQGSFRDHFCEKLKSFPLNRLHKYPIPKHSGLLFGHEVRIFLRYLSDQSSILDPSAFSRIYRSFAKTREQCVYRAFVLGELITDSEIVDLLGEQNIDLWVKNHLLDKEAKDRWRFSFRVIPVGGLILVVDPMVDCINLPFPYRVHIGQDSLNMVEFLTEQKKICQERYLDVGTGSGIILQKIGRNYKEAIGADINPRAVQLTNLNIELNCMKNCRGVNQDIFIMGDKLGKFDMVSWNTPLLFLPEDQKENNLDGYGGDMGIELALRFIEILPGLLTEYGQACVAAYAPILCSGDNLLEDKMKKLLPELGLDACVYVTQSTWQPKLREFHDSHGIKKFESTFIMIKNGSGKLQKKAPPFVQRVTDSVRGWLYQNNTLKTTSVSPRASTNVR